MAVNKGGSIVDIIEERERRKSTITGSLGYRERGRHVIVYFEGKPVTSPKLCLRYMPILPHPCG